MGNVAILRFGADENKNFNFLAIIKTEMRKLKLCNLIYYMSIERTALIVTTHKTE